MNVINGLPAHALLLHLVVVLVPLTALLEILCGLWPAARRGQLLWLTLVLATVAMVLTPITINAGQWLYDLRTKPSPILREHAERGGTMVYFAAALLAVAIGLVALRLIERGDLRADEMIGSWAGELGQTQMMPSEYMAHAIDYDGDGKRNLIKSAADVIGSSGKYLVHLGWKRGEPWLQEVRVPANLPWKEADLSIQHPRSQWAAWGVTRADGKPLPNDNMPASVVLPLGRFGPTFLAYDNFQAYLKWNQSLNYSLTAAYYATRLDGAPPMNRGSPNIPKITFEETRELQQLLEKRGYDVGRVDGVLGLKSRVAIRDTQIKFGLPADGWPTAELLTRLRTGR